MQLLAVAVVVAATHSDSGGFNSRNRSCSCFSNHCDRKWPMTTAMDGAGGGKTAAVMLEECWGSKCGGLCRKRRWFGTWIGVEHDACLCSVCSWEEDMMLMGDALWGSWVKNDGDVELTLDVWLLGSTVGKRGVRRGGWEDVFVGLVCDGVNKRYSGHVSQKLEHMEHGLSYLSFSACVRFVRGGWFVIILMRRCKFGLNGLMLAWNVVEKKKRRRLRLVCIDEWG